MGQGQGRERNTEKAPRRRQRETHRELRREGKEEERETQLLSRWEKQRTTVGKGVGSQVRTQGRRTPRQGSLSFLIPFT